MSGVKQQIDQNYVKVAEAIRQHGSPNPQFPKDNDLVYGELRKHLNATAGLATVLRNMRSKQYVDYRGDIINDSTIITLINDYEQDLVPQGITYDKINEQVKDVTDQSSHTKVGGW
ncbi:hypothetical protein QOT17_018571 [Balamuthia mandrillaris]